MKIFHVVEEISDKNNSIVTITKILLSYKNFQSSKIVTPYPFKNARFEKGIVGIKIFKNIFKFKSEVYNFLNFNKPDIVHIHGLWRPIHIFFIFTSIQLGIPLIIQPHGMLLDEAIRTKSKINYFFKLMIIMIYKILLKQAIFIAVTTEEKKSIYKYFNTKNIHIIPNPFNSTFKVERNLKKNISYYGRFSEHKNLDLIINSFHDADLGEKWKLLIYGIDDDLKYKEKIKNLIKTLYKNKNIFIKKPIFDKKEKFKKMSENYLNILMSKSEILSLSVLEALSVGTKSLVNNNIKYPNKISKLIYFTEPKKDLISKKMKSITDNFKQDYSARERVKNKFKKIYNIEKSKSSYEALTQKFSKLKSITAGVDLFNVSFANGLNSFLVPFLVVIYALINPSISAEIAIIEGTIIYFTQVFSSNSRAILLNEKNDELFINIISFRTLISTLILLFFIVFFSNINFIEQNFHLVLIALVLLSWTNEITLVFIEKKNLKFFLSIFILCSIIFYFILTINILSDRFDFASIIISYFIFHVFFINYFFNLIIALKLKQNLSGLYKNIFPFLSTLSNTTSVLFWRYSILFFSSKEIAGIIFAIFSIASFPGTFYNNILGQTILRQKRLDTLFSKYENIVYLISIFFIGVFYIYLKNNIYLIDIFTLNTIVLSFAGTIIMIKSLRKRHQALFKFFYLRNQVFKRDILYSISIFPLIIVLNYYNGIEAISYAYLLSAVISYFVYSINYVPNYKQS